jgi:hypothetical protein
MALPRTSNEDRRADIRLEGGGQIDAVVIDAYGFPSATLLSPRVENVSASGLAISTTTEVEAGSRVKVMVAGLDATEVPGVIVEVLSVVPQADGRLSLHCRVVDGTVPASLIFRW